MNYIQIEIPYWNELHAGSVGALSSFNENTPVPVMENSFLNLINWLTPGNQYRTNQTFSTYQQPRITNGREWDRIIREGQRRAEEQSPGTVSDSRRRFPDTGGIPGTPPINDNGDNRPLDRILDMMRGGTITKEDNDRGITGSTSGDCSTFDFGCQAEKFLTGDVAKRIGLLILAVVLIAVAVISLR